MNASIQLEARCWNLLSTVMDPEFPISIVDMGMIYNVKEVDGIVHISMSYTHTACPCMEWIQADIVKTLSGEPQVKEVSIQVVWDPPWTVDRMSSEARLKMKQWGVGS